MSTNNLLTMYDEIINNGGASYQLETGELNPKSGFMVSLLGYEQKFPIPNNVNEWQTIVAKYMLTRVKTNDEKNRPMIGLLVENVNYFLGAWVDSGFLYLDISENIPDFETAEKVGLERKQRAIFDCVNGESFYL